MFLKKQLESLLSFSVPADDKEYFNVAYGKRHIVFDVDNYSIISRLLDGDFLDYNAAVPKTCNTTVLINTDDAINCIERTLRLLKMIRKTQSDAYLTLTR